MPDETMPQVDFAPTLASLVGVPIPYGNLGTVNENIFNIAHGSKLRDDDALTDGLASVLPGEIGMLCLYPLVTKHRTSHFR